MATPHSTSRWRLGSVRARATLLAGLVVGVALAVAAVALLLTLQHSLVRSGDDAAVARARDLLTLAGESALPPTVTAPGEDDVVQVLDSRGGVVSASDNLRGRGPIATFRPDGADPAVRTLHDVADGAERESYRVWAVQADAVQGPLVVYVGTSLEQVSEATSLLRTTMSLGLPLMLLLVVGTTWLLLGRALRPVEAIRSQVAVISGTALERRVPVPRSDDEVGRLAHTMNAMLDRLESASRRQREFVADASHELQSPLASFRTQLEVSLAHPASTDWLATAVELLADSDRMERLVADLLYLARTDAVPPQPTKGLVDLDDIVLDEANRARSHSRVRIDTAGVSAAPVRGGGDELRRMTRNLLDNAVRHARQVVRVELRATTEQVVLTVEDDGPGVPAEQAEKMFERFVRLEDARGHEHGGTGLGLAIVQAIAVRHQGGVALESAGAGARLVVRLPVPGPVRGSASPAVRSRPTVGPGPR